MKYVLLAVCLLAASVLLSAAEPGFVSLFNGRDLDGWVLMSGKGPGYVVENGAIVCPENGGGNLLSEKEYANFILRFEFRLSEGGNNGIAIRAPMKSGSLAYEGTEIQVIDNDAPVYKDIKDWQRHGSIYGIVPAKTGFLKKVGEWNEEEITINGTHFKVVLNGTTIVDADVSKVSPIDGKEHPGIKRTSGHIGFLGHDTRVEFRNIRIKELK